MQFCLKQLFHLSSRRRHCFLIYFLHLSFFYTIFTMANFRKPNANWLLKTMILLCVYIRQTAAKIENSLCCSHNIPTLVLFVSFSTKFNTNELNSSWINVPQYFSIRKSNFSLCSIRSRLNLTQCFQAMTRQQSDAWYIHTLFLLLHLLNVSEHI